MSTSEVFGGDPGSYREEFLYAVEVARAKHDPAEDWDGFREALWSYLARVFGLDESPSWSQVPGCVDEESAGGTAGAEEWAAGAE